MRNLIIDCFAGGGGASVGIEMATGREVDIAINHDAGAIRMHKMNHTKTLHLTEDIFKVDLKKYVGNDHVALMWASPACQAFSRAKGSKFPDDQLRILPWSVFKHAKTVRPDVIIMENVVEIQTWGPLDENGMVIKERQGEEYRRFISQMKALGYDFDSRELVAADYGAPTIRKRWYAIFRCDGKPIVWPEATHNRDGNDGLEKWIPASTVLDFTNTGKSIFNRKKPLADKTLNRIARGIQKFVAESDAPFVFEAGNQKVASFLTKFYKSGIGQSLDEPLHTITTSAGHFGLVSLVLTKDVSPEHEAKSSWAKNFIIEYYGRGLGQSVDEPLHTIVTKDRFALVTVCGEEYTIVDIRLRMLTPHELKLAQGFPEDYIINRDLAWRELTTKEQVLRIGNSVVPKVAEVLVSANLPELREGERTPNIQTFYEASGQMKFAQ